ncbi:MAG: AAA family ATPase [Methanobrevibacter sp.]|nr:AAA family ATPase [Methanobrevibacter sp.]
MKYPAYHFTVLQHREKRDNMHITNIKIKNLKTFKDVSLDLNRFNVIIGASGCGKTNFVEIFELLKDISQNFHNAIKKHGGIYVKNLNTDEDSYLKCRFEKQNDEITLNDSGTTLDFTGLDYEIGFRIDEKSTKVLNEIVRLKFNTDKSGKENTIIIKNNNGEITAEFLNDTDLNIQDIFPDILLDIVSQRFKSDNTALINSALSSLPFEWGDLFKNIASYDFDAKSIKKIGTVKNDLKLTRHGDNLAKVLEKILADEKKDFMALYTDMLPHILDVAVENILSENHYFTIKEDSGNAEIPAPFVSDASCTVMAMIIAFYFENNEIILIEHPERHIHPPMIPKLMAMMESVKDRQVIITTHSPDVLKYAEPEDIFHISRDEKGFSHIGKITDNEVIQPFVVSSELKARL